MRPGERFNNFIVVCITVCLAIAAGVLIPFFGGSRLTDTTIAWTPPPVPASTVTTATQVRMTPRLPSPTVTVAPTTVTPPTATATPTVTVTPTRTLPPTVAPTALTSTAVAPTTVTPTAPLARVLVGPTNLRAGPGSTFPVVAQAQAGDTFTVTGRSNDGTWWQICCVQDLPVWVAADLVSVSGPTDQLSEPRESLPPGQ